MSYNRSFTNMAAQPGRYNKTGQFVPATEPETPVRATRSTAASLNANLSAQVSSDLVNPPAPEPAQSQIFDNDVKMESAEQVNTSTENEWLNEDGTKKKPSWMKSGIKKISNKERRRRQNEHLRKLLTPKNALMVLNEMVGNQGHQPISANCQVQQTDNNFFGSKLPSFCADFNLEGKTYRGFGETKIAARNSAAEQAIRDLVISKMKNQYQQPAESSGVDTSNGDETAAAKTTENEPFPMIQLASYALHKLFTDWQCEGLSSHVTPTQLMNSQLGQVPSVPLVLPSEPRVSKPKPSKGPKGPKTLPADAASMHPCMLLCNMRPGLVYHELGVEGDKPQNMMFTMGVTVDGTTYIGKASSKKEARRLAGRSACQEVFKLQYTD